VGSCSLGLPTVHLRGSELTQNAATVDILRCEGDSRALKRSGRNQRERNESLVRRIFASWNQLDGWLRAVDGLRRVA